MTNQQKARVLRIWGIATGVGSVAAGLCLMGGCLKIYLSGDQPYSREAVAQAFRPIAPVVYLCLALIAGGLLLHWLLPLSSKEPVRIPPELPLRRLRQTTDLSACPAPLAEQIRQLRKEAGVLAVICGVLVAIFAGILLVYSLNGSHFHRSDINGSVVKAMQLLLPCLAVPFGYGIFAAYRTQALARQEMALLKQARSQGAKKQPQKAEKKPAIRWVQAAFVTVGAILLIGGLLTGGTADVLTKAINICTECIGLG